MQNTGVIPLWYAALNPQTGEAATRSSKRDYAFAVFAISPRTYGAVVYLVGFTRDEKTAAGMCRSASKDHGATETFVVPAYCGATEKEAVAKAVLSSRKPNPMDPEQMYYEGEAMAISELLAAVQRARRKVGPRLYHGIVQQGYRDTLDRLAAIIAEDYEE